MMRIFSLTAIMAAVILTAGCTPEPLTKADVDGRVVCNVDQMDQVERSARPGRLVDVADDAPVDLPPWWLARHGPWVASSSPSARARDVKPDATPAAVRGVIARVALAVRCGTSGLRAMREFPPAHLAPTAAHSPLRSIKIMHTACSSSRAYASRRAAIARRRAAAAGMPASCAITYACAKSREAVLSLKRRHRDRGRDLPGRDGPVRTRPSRDQAA